MRRLLAALLLISLAASTAQAQDAGDVRAPGRRKAIAPVSAAPAPGATLVKATPAPRPRPLASPIGSAPQCRAQCAQTRYVCTAQMGDGEGGDCNVSWSQCVVGCGGSAYSFSDTAPKVFGLRDAPP